MKPNKFRHQLKMLSKDPRMLLIKLTLIVGKNRGHPEWINRERVLHRPIKEIKIKMATNKKL